MVQEQAGAVVVLADPMLGANRLRLAELSAKYRLPSISPFREAAEYGGLISYGPSLVANFRRAATYIDRILKGAKPADLPVEQPTKFELFVNVKTATALGLTVPGIAASASGRRHRVMRSSSLSLDAGRLHQQRHRGADCN